MTNGRHVDEPWARTANQPTTLPACTHACLQIDELSSPNPIPIDRLINAHFIARKAHESIKGLKIKVGGGAGAAGPGECSWLLH
jgi:hypothetical protein